MDFEPLRLVTVHPALTHVTVGMLPILVVAYAVAAATRSAKWTFAGDLALAIATLFTVATFAFGLVSNAMLFWPGGLGSWRWVHLALGAIGTAILLLLSAVRWRRRRLPAGTGFATAVVLCALAIAVNGWVGGEVLVYHAGMAVKGGALGADAPPLASTDPPRDFMDAMGGLRAHLAAISDDVTVMVVKRPQLARFLDAKKNAIALGKLALWLDEHPHALEEQDRRGRRVDKNVPSPVAGHEKDDQRGEARDDEGATSSEIEIANYAAFLEEAAEKIARAADAKDLQALAVELGRTQASCAGCHESQRWMTKSGGAPPAGP